MSFNLRNYFIATGKRYAPIKSEKSKVAIAEVIKKAKPDILMISEIGGEYALKDFISYLKKRGLNYPFRTVMYGADKTRYIGCIAKFAPVFVRKKYDLTYDIKPKSEKKQEKVYVRRGFLHILFDIDGYKLHIINAHLKSRLPHLRYNQKDMRRSEAELLKNYTNDIIKRHPKANILIVGDFNDVYNSSPIKILRGMKRKSENRLYDLRPLDNAGSSWTYWWEKEDSYERIDYMLTSPSLLPEIDLKKTQIDNNLKLCLHASDHRPVITVIRTKDKKTWSESKINSLFKNGIRKGELYK